MTISPGVKRQLWISFWVLFVWAATTLIVLRDEVQRAVMGAGEEDVASMSPELSELTWEILVVDPELRDKLWAKYEQSSLEEKEQAFKAVVHMLAAITPEQAQHLTEQMLARSGESSSRPHRQKLFEMLERLVKKHKDTLREIAHYAAKNLNGEASVTKKIDIKKMMDNIETEIGDTPYRACMDGKEEQIKRCTQMLVKSEQKSALDHIKGFFKKEKLLSKRSEALIVLAKMKVSYGKEHVPDLLKSTNMMEVKLALRLIREYGLTQYTADIKSMRGSNYDTVRDDLESTINYLLIDHRKPANE